MLRRTRAGRRRLLVIRRWQLGMGLVGLLRVRRLFLGRRCPRRCHFLLLVDRQQLRGHLVAGLLRLWRLVRCRRGLVDRQRGVVEHVLRRGRRRLEVGGLPLGRILLVGRGRRRRGVGRRGLVVRVVGRRWRLAVGLRGCPVVGTGLRRHLSVRAGHGSLVMHREGGAVLVRLFGGGRCRCRLFGGRARWRGRFLLRRRLLRRSSGAPRPQGTRCGRLGVGQQLLGDLLETHPPLLRLPLVAIQKRGEIPRDLREVLDRAGERDVALLAPLLGAERRVADGHHAPLHAGAARLGRQHGGDVLEARGRAVAAGHHDRARGASRQVGRHGVGRDPSGVDDHRHLGLGDGAQLPRALVPPPDDLPGTSGTGRGRHDVQVVEQDVLGVVDEVAATHR